MKKYLIVILCAMLIGGISAYFLFSKLVLKEEIIDGMSKVSAFQVGVFSNYDNALKVADRNNGIVIPEDDLYRVYVAILKDKEAINKVSDYYNEIGLNYYLKEIMVSNDFITEIKDDEELLKKSSKETYNTINLDVLKKYEELL